MSGYRPNRSQQLAIAAMVNDTLNLEFVDIVVHHVIEDTPLKLTVQLEVRRKIRYSDVGEWRDPMSAINRPNFIRMEL